MKKILLPLLAWVVGSMSLLAQPVITTQPTNQIVLNGSNVVFSVAVSGTGPFTYQWQFNGTNLPTTNVVVTTVAGHGNISGYSGDGGLATNATLNSPHGVAVDALGNIYIADKNNRRVRLVDTNGFIRTFAGNGSTYFSGDGGNATNAGLYAPEGVAVDSSGNVFIASAGNFRVRKVDTNGIITTVAGNGSSTYSGDGGAATNAGINPYGVAVDNHGNVFIAEPFNNRIRMVDTNGFITTVAGTNSSGFSGDGGPAVNAKLNTPYGVAVDALGNIFIADNFNSRIRKVDTNGIISTVAGKGPYGNSGDGGAATNALLKSPTGVFVDAYGYLFIADNANSDPRIRQVDSKGIITTLVANNWLLISASGVTVDGIGNMYIADGVGSWIDRATLGRNPVLSLNNVTTNNAGNYQVIVASPSGSVTSSVVTLSVVFPPSVVAQPQNEMVTNGSPASFNVSVSGTPPIFFQWQKNGVNLTDGGDLSGSATNALSFGTTTTNDPGYYAVILTNAYGCVTSSIVRLNVVVPPSISLPPTNQIIMSGSNAIFSVSVSGTGPFTYQWQFNGTNLPHRNGGTNPPSYFPNTILTVAGKGGSFFGGDGGPATSANFINPYGVTVDGYGNTLIADKWNNRIRKVNSNGIIVTVAGVGPVASNGSYGGDGSAATNANLNFPVDVAVDVAGNLFIADSLNNRIRKVDINGIITTVAGTNTFGYSGDGGLAVVAKLRNPSAVTVDGFGNLFIADTDNNRIRKVGASGIITTIAGNGTAGYAGDGGIATAASLNGPHGVALDGNGNCYISDTTNHCIRKVDINGIITTFAGIGTAGYSGDGGMATNANLNQPYGITADAYGQVYFADFNNSRIRGVNASGIISTFAGNGAAGFSGDFSAATNAGLNFPSDICLDASGNLLIADEYNNRIRMVDSWRTATLALSNVTANLMGAYQVIVTSPYGSVTSSIVALTVLLPPSITTQPANISVTNGGAASFNVAVSGTAPLGYQWFTSSGRNATAAPVMINGVVYRVTITSGGSEYSSVPQVQFVGGSGFGASGTAVVNSGMVTAINMTSSGFSYYTAPPLIQIAGPSAISSSLSDQTNAMLALPVVTSDDATNYFVVVTNNYGSVTSATVTVTVFLPPQSFTAQSLANGLQMQLTGTPNYPYILQLATNLTPPVSWKSIRTNYSDANGNWQFTDTNLNGGQKFYRAVGQ